MKLLQVLGVFWLATAVYIPAAATAEIPVWWERAEIAAQREGYRLVTQQQLQTLYRLQPDFLILDVRPAYQYKAGHLPRAVQLELDPGDRYHLKPDKQSRLESVLGSDKTRTIIIYCQDYN